MRIRKLIRQIGELTLGICEIFDVFARGPPRCSNRESEMPRWLPLPVHFPDRCPAGDFDFASQLAGQDQRQIGNCRNNA